MRSTLNGLVEMIVNMSAASAPNWQVTMHARRGSSTAVTGAEMLALATEMQTQLVTPVTTLCNNSQTITNFEVQSLGPERLPSEIVLDGTVGTRGTSIVAQNSCVVVTTRTAFIGRAYRGRQYWSGLVAADLDDGSTWDVAAINRAVDCTQAFLDACAACTPVFTPVIYHRAAGVGGTPAADSVTPIESLLGRPNVYKQGKRSATV